VVVLSAVIAVVGAVVGSGFAGGTPIQDAAGGALRASATPIAPAGGAFSIWSVIYLGLVIYAIWQALPRQHSAERQRVIGYWVAASLILNAAWILSIQFDLLAASLPVIVVLLIVLIRTFLLCVGSRPTGWFEAVVVDGTIGLYLGWVCVATAANAAAVLAVAGFTSAPVAWAIAIVIAAGVIGILLAVRDNGRIAPMLSLAWGIAWIAIGRLTGAPHSAAIGTTAIISAAAVVIATVIVRLRQPRGAAGRTPRASSRRSH
jgi:hypothetical protein